MTTEIHLHSQAIEVCTVSYGPSIFPDRFMDQGQSVQAIISRESITYSTDREDEVTVRYLLYLYCVSNGSETISIHAERLQISDVPQKQNESIANCC